MRREPEVRPQSAQAGLTLVEMIVAIVVAGILLAMVGMFTRNQITAYQDVAARAELTDAADTALRRIGRELQAALPNSVRTDDSKFIEFVPIKDAGRYRAQKGDGASDDELDFSSATDNSFEVFGPPVKVNNGDKLVIYNLGVTGFDVYAGDTRRDITSVGAVSKVIYTVGTAQFPLASPQSRFQVVGSPVSYACDTASGNLLRYANYGFQSPQVTTVAGLNALAAPSILVSGVTECSFTYLPGASSRNGLVSMRLKLARNGESVTLLHQVNVSNTP